MKALMADDADCGFGRLTDLTPDSMTQTDRMGPLRDLAGAATNAGVRSLALASRLSAGSSTRPL